MENEFLLKRYENIVKEMNTIIAYCNQNYHDCKRCGLYKKTTRNKCLLCGVPFDWLEPDFDSILLPINVKKAVWDIGGWCVSGGDCDYCPFRKIDCLLEGIPQIWKERLREEKAFYEWRYGYEGL